MARLGRLRAAVDRLSVWEVSSNRFPVSVPAIPADILVEGIAVAVRLVLHIHVVVVVHPNVLVVCEL